MKIITTIQTRCHKPLKCMKNEKRFHHDDCQKYRVPDFLINHFAN